MIVRSVCRAVLLTPAEEVLLIKIREPTTGWTAWITPGGGAKPGENPQETLRRELLEETGRDDFESGRHVWHRDHTTTWEGRLCRQIEEFYLIRTTRFEPTFENQPEAVENRAFRGFRWWSIDEVETSDETFVPLRLGALLRELQDDGVPSMPVETGE